VIPLLRNMKRRKNGKERRPEKEKWLKKTQSKYRAPKRRKIEEESKQKEMKVETTSV